MIRIALLILLLASPAFAQQPSVAEMRAAVAASVAQTDAIRNMHIQAEARGAALADENTKLKAQVQELEKKLAAPAEAK